MPRTRDFQAVKDEDENRMHLRVAECCGSCTHRELRMEPHGDWRSDSEVTYCTLFSRAVRKIQVCDHFVTI